MVLCICHVILCLEAPFFREEEEDWEQDNFPPTTLAIGLQDNFPPTTLAMGLPGGAEGPGLGLMGECYDDGEKEAELEDFLVGDDPAAYSDEFSGPEYEF